MASVAFASPLALRVAPPRRAPRASSAETPVCKRAPAHSAHRGRRHPANPRTAPSSAPVPKAKAKMPKAARGASGMQTARFGPCLVLNADFQPLSIMPLSLVSWQESIKAVYANRVVVVATYPQTYVRSPSSVFPLPSVVCLKKYKATATGKVAAFSRFNLSLRDQFCCQYCNTKLESQELTFDHVVPRCLGGHTSWTNVVAACEKCNHRKGRRLLKEMSDMKLLRQPLAPTNGDLQRRARAFPPRNLHATWRDYCYWNESMKTEKAVEEE